MRTEIPSGCSALRKKACSRQDWSLRNRRGQTWRLLFELMTLSFQGRSRSMATPITPTTSATLKMPVLSEPIPRLRKSVTWAIMDQPVDEVAHATGGAAGWRATVFHVPGFSRQQHPQQQLQDNEPHHALEYRRPDQGRQRCSHAEECAGILRMGQRRVSPRKDCETPRSIWVRTSCLESWSHPTHPSRSAATRPSRVSLRMRSSLSEAIHGPFDAHQYVGSRNHRLARGGEAVQLRIFTKCIESGFGGE